MRDGAQLHKALEAKLPRQVQELLNCTRRAGHRAEWLTGPADAYARLIVPDPTTAHEITLTDSLGRPFREATIVEASNGISVNYHDLRNSKRPAHDRGFVVADGLPSSKLALPEAFEGISLESLRTTAATWLQTRDLVVIPSRVGHGATGSMLDVAYITTKEMAWAKLAWDIMHGTPTPEGLCEDFNPRAIFMAVPGLRPTLFGGTQTTIFDRHDDVMMVYPVTSYQGLGMSKKPIFVCLSHELVSRGKGFLAHATMVVMKNPDSDSELGLVYWGKSGHGKTEAGFPALIGNDIVVGRSINPNFPQVTVTIPKASRPHITIAGDDGVAFTDLSPSDGYGVGQNHERGFFDRPSSAKKVGDLPRNDQIFEAGKLDPYSILCLNYAASPGQEILTHERIRDGGKPHSNPRVSFSSAALASTPAITNEQMAVSTEPIRLRHSIFGMGTAQGLEVLSWAHKLPLCSAYAVLLAGVSQTNSVSVEGESAENFRGLAPDRYGTMQDFTIVPHVDMANRLWNLVSGFHNMQHWACPVGFIGPAYSSNDNEAELLLRDMLYHIDANNASWKLVPAPVPTLGLIPSQVKIFDSPLLPEHFNNPLLQFATTNAYYDAAQFVVNVMWRGASLVVDDPRLNPAAKRALLKAFNAPLRASSTDEAWRIYKDLNEV